MGGISMPFMVEEIEQESFNTWNELNSYVEEESKKYVRIPIEDFFVNNAQFSNDEFFGCNNYWVKFNEDGMKSLFRLLNIPPYIIDNLTKDGLASKVLNDLITETRIRDKLKNYQFVLNEKTMTVSGLVSKTYVPYSNHLFLEDIKRVFPDIILNFKIEKSYIINTSLYLRLLSPEYKTGIISGNRGQSDDISKIGLQLSNNMTGRNSIKASYFVFRLVCSNGLILPCTEVNGVVKHSGKKETFLERISNNITPVIEKVKNIPQKIETLGSIRFDLEKLAYFDGAKYIFDIFPLVYADQRKREKLRGVEKVKFDKEKIEEYINKYSMELSQRVFKSYFRDNQSMFDFINIFTEYAKTEQPREKTRIEEKSGNLANWILKNKEEFDL
jgi:hypothetical protein